MVRRKRKGVGRFDPFPTPDRTEPRAAAPPDHDGPDSGHRRRLSAYEAYRRAAVALADWRGDD